MISCMHHNNYQHHNYNYYLTTSFRRKESEYHCNQKQQMFLFQGSTGRLESADE